MTITTGKRKRRESLSDQESIHLPESHQNHSDNSQALFRKHFEVQFAPLELPSPPSRPLEIIDSERAHDESESDWDGISDDGGFTTNVFEHQSTEPWKGEIPHEEFKSFMVWTPFGTLEYPLLLFSPFASLPDLHLRARHWPHLIENKKNRATQTRQPPKKPTSRTTSPFNVY